MTDLGEMKVSDVLQIAKMFSGQGSADDSHWKIGQPYLIRTVTMIDTGRLVKVTPNELVLEDAAWIASTDRFSDAVANCEFGEVEPFPDGQVIIGRGAVIDAVMIKEIQRTQK